MGRDCFGQQVKILVLLTDKIYEQPTGKCRYKVAWKQKIRRE